LDGPDPLRAALGAVAIGLHLHAAVSLAEQIAEILGAPAPARPS
jgi:hypothetical protein